MRLVVYTDSRFARLSDGSVWTTSSYANRFWKKYLREFSRVLVVARLQQVDERKVGWQRCDGDGVDFSPVPYFHGPVEYLTRSGAVSSSIRSPLKPDDAILLRVPAVIPSLAAKFLIQTGRPFAIEVLGDPYDSLGPGAARHPARFFFRWLYTRRLRAECSYASVASYVTKHALQKRYPPTRAVFVTDYSDIELGPADFSDRQRMPVRNQPPSVILIGTLEQMYKGVDVLIEAVSLLARSGFIIDAVVVGDGRFRDQLQTLAKQFGIADQVRFLGHVSDRDRIRAALDDADLFVMPSLQEGLPRALIEAMARGLPCVATSVGGIPELLQDPYLVPPRDPLALAREIRRVLESPDEMHSMSLRNRQSAGHYASEHLLPKCHELQRHLRSATETHLSGQPRSGVR